MPLVELDGVEIFYNEAGEGQVPLLLLPGLGTDCSCWGGCYAGWLKDFRLIMPDFRGVGRSADGEGDLSFEQYATDLRNLLEYLGIKKTHILGHSMGGMVAMVFTRMFPELVDKLVIASSSYRSTPFAAQVVRSWNAIKQTSTPEDFFNAALPWMVTRKYFEKKAQCEGALRFFLKYPYPQSQQNFARQLTAMRGFDFSGEIPEISAEVMIIGGDDDLLFSASEQAAFAKMFNDAQLVLIKNMAHSPMLEQGAAFAAAVSDFLLS